MSVEKSLKRFGLQHPIVARYECPRCGEVCFTTNPEHLCKDIAKRLARRERQVEEVMDILLASTEEISSLRTTAEQIVLRLSQLGVTDE